MLIRGDYHSIQFKERLAKPVMANAYRTQVNSPTPSNLQTVSAKVQTHTIAPKK